MSQKSRIAPYNFCGSARPCISSKTVRISPPQKKISRLVFPDLFILQLRAWTSEGEEGAKLVKKKKLQSEFPKRSTMRNALVCLILALSASVAAASAAAAEEEDGPAAPNTCDSATMDCFTNSQPPPPISEDPRDKFEGINHVWKGLPVTWLWPTGMTYVCWTSSRKCVFFRASRSGQKSPNSLSFGRCGAFWEQIRDRQNLTLARKLPVNTFLGGHTASSKGEIGRVYSNRIYWFISATGKWNWPSAETFNRASVPIDSSAILKTGLEKTNLFYAPHTNNKKLFLPHFSMSK